MIQNVAQFLWFVVCCQVNVLALCICTKEAIKLMKECGIDDGRIIHMNRCASAVHCLTVASTTTTNTFGFC